MAILDPRARIYAKPQGSEYVFGPNTEDNILRPLIARGLVFAYTPNVTGGGSADYDEYSFTHSNYKYSAYNKSAPTEITIDGPFTAQTNDEARYLLAVLHFLKSATKSYFGVSDGNRAGTPPPVMLFDYLGETMYKKTPVILKSYQYTLDNDVDYVLVKGWDTYVPAKMMLSITLDFYYNPKVLRDKFSLSDFQQGKYLGVKGKTGGFV
jgi:hypothetical protein